MKKREAKKIKYDGFSMVEMLITLLIMGVVMILVGVTLTSLIKASAISSARTLSRNEKEFMFDLIERYIENADPEEILVYDVSGRYVDDTGAIRVYSEFLVAASFANVVLPSSGTGNEIHIRPTGSSSWVCLAFYPDANYANSSDPDASIGYIVKATSDSLTNHADCISSANPDLQESLIFLNAREIDVELFDVRYYRSASENYTFMIDLGLQPTNWVAGRESKYKPIYRDQLVVSTDKILY